MNKRDVSTRNKDIIEKWISYLSIAFLGSLVKLFDESFSEKSVMEYACNSNSFYEIATKFLTVKNIILLGTPIILAIFIMLLFLVLNLSEDKSNSL